MPKSRNGRDRSAQQKPAGWEFQHSPYTVEGTIEGVRRFAEGISHAKGWRRRFAIGLALTYPVSIALALLIGLIRHLVRILG